MAVLDIDGAVDNVKVLLKGLATWQAICGVSTAAEAAERIHKGGIEEGEPASETPYIILDVDPFQGEWKPDAINGDLTIEARVELEVPPENCRTYSEQYTWVWQQHGGLLREISAGVRGAGQLMLQSLSTPLKPSRIDPDDTGGRVEWAFTIGLTVRLI